MDFVKAYLGLDARASSEEAKADEYRERADNRRWEQSRLAYEATTEGGFTQRTFAQAVGKSPKTIRDQVQLWQRWGGEHDPQLPPYHEAYAELVGRPPEAKERTRRMVNMQARNLPTEDKARLVGEFIRESAVAANAARDALADRAANLPRIVADHAPERINDVLVIHHGQYLLRALTAMEDGQYEPGVKAALILTALRPRTDWDAELAALNER